MINHLDVLTNLQTILIREEFGAVCGCVHTDIYGENVNVASGEATYNKVVS